MRQERGCINRHNTTELRPDLQVIFNRQINCGPDLGSHARNGLNRVNRPFLISLCRGLLGRVVVLGGGRGRSKTGNHGQQHSKRRLKPPYTIKFREA
eukprot:scaffold42139_cov24-Attheya_sp.AAC.1